MAEVNKGPQAGASKPNPTPVQAAGNAAAAKVTPVDVWRRVARQPRPNPPASGGAEPRQLLLPAPVERGR
mgnify:CR=1 FL=1